MFEDDGCASKVLGVLVSRRGKRARMVNQACEEVDRTLGAAPCRSTNGRQEVGRDQPPENARSSSQVLANINTSPTKLFNTT